MIIKLVRHGESKANADGYNNRDIADSSIPLTDKGWEQAREAGRQLGFFAGDAVLTYSSPYLRARQTLEGIYEGALRRPVDSVYEDPRLREVDHGYQEVESQYLLQDIHGAFFYRFNGGESPADCYDRVSTFLETMMRDVRDNHARAVLIVSHGITIRCFVMRFLHLTVEEFNMMRNPQNCDIITIEPHRSWSDDYQFLSRSERWQVSGLRLRDNT